MQLEVFYHRDGHPTIQKAAGRERPATAMRAQGPYTTTKPPDAASSSNCPAFQFLSR